MKDRGEVVGKGKKVRGEGGRIKRQNIGGRCKGKRPKGRRRRKSGDY